MFILFRKKMGLGFLVDQIYLVSLGNYDPHAKIEGLLNFLFIDLYSTVLKTEGPSQVCNLLNSQRFQEQVHHNIFVDPFISLDG